MTVASLLAQHITKKEQMKTQRKCRIGTASNNYWAFKPVLRRANLHYHLPPRFTQFSWLFGAPINVSSRATIKISEKTVMKQG